MRMYLILDKIWVRISKEIYLDDAKNIKTVGEKKNG